MSGEPVVSVVIATYNYGHYLGRALDSVLAQTFRDYEVIVIDDGSTDDTPSVVQPYLGRDPVFYHRVEHVGVTLAKNHGLRKARGRYVAFLDSDDEWLPGKLERQLGVFASDPGVGLVYTRRMVIDPDDRFLRVDLGELYRGNVARNLLLDNFICYSSAMVRRAALEEVGLLDESVVHPSDYDLWLRISLRYRFEYIDEPLTKYREHPGISRKKTPLDLRAEVDFVTNRFLNEYGGRMVIEPAILKYAELLRLCNLGFYSRELSRSQACRYYSLALLKAPSFWPAWRGLLAALLPESGRRLVRRLPARRANPTRGTE